MLVLGILKSPLSNHDALQINKKKSDQILKKSVKLKTFQHLSVIRGGIVSCQYRETALVIDMLTLHRQL